MINTSTNYKTEIKKPSRSFECKVTIGDNVYTNEDIVNIVLDYPQSQDGFSIGNTISQSLDLTLINNGDTIFSTSQVKVEIGLKVGSTIEYIPMGIFNIDDIEKTDYTTKLTCYDNMIKFETPYFSELGDKPTLQQVVNELSSKTGVKFAGTIPAYTVSKLDGFTCREVLSYVASICAGNAVVNRDGNIVIKSLEETNNTISKENYFDYTKEETAYKIGKISCQVEDNNILSKGALGTDSMELIFENPWVTETILTEIYNKLNGLTYLGYSIRWQGDLSLEPYDIVSITDTKNVTRKTPILAQKFTYTGGLTSEIEAKGESKNQNSFSSSGSTTNKVNRVVIEQAIIKDALMDKATIKDLEATNAKIQNLVAEDAKINNALINKAEIKDLNATNANIQNLIAEDAKINHALINKADITQLNAVQGNITSLNSEVANIKTLVNGNLSSENIQAGGITSDKLTIANGFIKNAMIDNLDVSKVNAGDISTNKFRIVSDNGKMLIADNTIQIRDNDRARVQIGKDASDDYNMYVWDNAGNLMFDATGLKADGIKNKIIRDDMISDNANIDGSKINVGSLVTEINKDTNTSVIKSSKVQLDTVGQTLDVAFNSLKTNVDNIEIGGRNIALGTNQGTGWYWALENGGWSGSEVIENGIRCSKLTRDNTPATGWSYIAYERIGRNKYVAGRQYTVSFEVKASVPAHFTCSFLEGNSSNGLTTELVRATVHEANKWTKLIFNVTMKDELPDSTSQILYLNEMNAGVGVSYTFRNLMIEEGTKASAWTPAPEDINNAIEDVKQITENNSTTINVMQGQISTAINNTQIVKDGETVLLKDDYNRTVAKVDSINSTIGSHTTKIDQLTGNITNVDTKVNSVQRDLEGTKSAVSSHSTSIDNLSSTVSTQGSSISQLKDQIALKVEQTDINNAINDISVGGRNLAFKNAISAFGASSINLDNYIKRGDITVWKPDGEYNGGFHFDKLVGYKPETRYVVQFYMTCTEHTIRNIHFHNGQNIIKSDVYVDDVRVGVIAEVINTSIFDDGKTHKVRMEYTTPAALVDSSGGTNQIYFQPNKTIADPYTIFIQEFKVEEGNKATTWTPATEDIDNAISNVDDKVTTTISKLAELKLTTDSITQRVQSTENSVTTVTNKFNNLQIGGRNLCTGTKNWDGNWREGFNVTLTDEYYQGLRVYTANHQWAYYYQEVVLEANTDYTVSCWVKTNVAGTQVGCYIWNGDGASIITLNEVDKWVRYTFTYRNPNKEMQVIRLESPNSINGAKLYLCGFKLEKGNKATDWTPAPEDIDSAINDRIIYARGTGCDYLNNRILRIGNKTIYDDTGRGVRVTALDPATLEIRSDDIYDLHEGGHHETNFVNKINELNEGYYIIVVTSWDNAYLHWGVRCEALYKIGGFAPNPSLDAYREAYALIGKSKLGKGNGIEMYIPRTETDKRHAEVSVKVGVNGEFVGVNSPNIGHQIDTIDTKIETTKNRVSEIVTSLDSINLKVQSTEQTVINHTTQIGQVDNKITNANNKIDNLAIGGRNLLLDSGIAVTNNDYCIKTYTPSELLIAGETYTVTICVTPANNVQYFSPYMSSGYASQCVLSVNGTNKQIVSGVFKASYYPDRVPTKPSDGHARISVYRFPNDGTVVTDSTMHWIKIEKGNKATDWTPAPEDINNAITSVDTKIEMTTNKLSELKLETDSITQRVQSTENKVTTVTNNLNNLQIGGRNLWRFTKEYDGSKYDKWCDNNEGNSDLTPPHTHINGFGVQRIAWAWHDMSQRVPIEPYTNYTLSAWVKWENEIGELMFYTNSGTMNNTNLTSQVGTSDFRRVSITFNSNDGNLSTCRFECTSGIPYLIYGLKLEKGTKATDWTPAPEDIDSAITSVDSKIETTKNQVASIETNLSGITQRVESSEQTIININNNKEDKKSRYIFARGTGNDYWANSYVEVEGRCITDGQGRGLRINVLNPKTLEHLAREDYDTFADWNAVNAFIRRINELNNGDYIIIVTSLDASYPWRCKDVLRSIGGSLLPDTEDTYREAYALIGRSRLGQGNGVEMYITKTASDRRHADVSVKVGPSGEFIGVNGSNMGSTIITTNNKIASIETALDSITSKVSSTENKFESVNGTVTNLTSRVNTAEQKITPTAITSTISEAINNGSGAVNTTKFTMDRYGLTIKNGGLAIQNNYGDTVFSSDTSGNLKLTGHLNTCTFRGKNMVYIEDNGTLSCDGTTYIRHLSVLETHPGWAYGTRGSFDCAPTANFKKEVRTEGEFWARNNSGEFLGVIRRGAYKPGVIQIDRMRVINEKHGSANNYVEVACYNSNHVFGIDLWSSDEKLKENIVSIEDNNTELLNDDASKTGLDLINNLNHYSFDYKKSFGGDHVTCGYVAQELQELNDSLVMEVEQQDGTTLLQPKASNIIPNLSLAIKQQQKMIEDLKAEIEELKSKIRA